MHSFTIKYYLRVKTLESILLVSINACNLISYQIEIVNSKMTQNPLYIPESSFESKTNILDMKLDIDDDKITLVRKR